MKKSDNRFQNDFEHLQATSHSDLRENFNHSNQSFNEIRFIFYQCHCSKFDEKNNQVKSRKTLNSALY